MQDVFPQGMIARPPLLEQMGRLHGFLLVERILLGLCTGRRIDLFQLSDCKRRLLRVRPFIVLPEIDQIRTAAL